MSLYSFKHTNPHKTQVSEHESRESNQLSMVFDSVKVHQWHNELIKLSMTNNVNNFLFQLRVSLRGD